MMFFYLIQTITAIVLVLYFVPELSYFINRSESKNIVMSRSFIFDHNEYTIPTTFVTSHKLIFYLGAIFTDGSFLLDCTFCAPRYSLPARKKCSLIKMNRQ